MAGILIVEKLAVAESEATATEEDLGKTVLIFSVPERPRV